MQILAISGSLRAVSKNTALLQAAALVAPAGVEVALYPALADLVYRSGSLSSAGRSHPPRSAAAA